MAKAKDKKSLIQDITNRYRVTAREARDIVTAVGTLGRTIVDKNVVPDYTKRNSNAGKAALVAGSPRRSVTEAAERNLVKQVRETASAALKGKKGTTSAKIKTDFRDQFGNPRGGMYQSAKKRTPEVSRTIRKSGQTLKKNK